MKFVPKILLAMVLVGVASCSDSFQQIDAAALQLRLDDSINHSAVSWWSAGHDEDSYFLVEKWPTKQFRYKVSKSSVDIKTAAAAGGVLEESDWVALKLTDIRFLE
jgi:hypothetical protein